MQPICNRDVAKCHVANNVGSEAAAAMPPGIR